MCFLPWGTIDKLTREMRGVMNVFQSSLSLIRALTPHGYWFTDFYSLFQRFGGISWQSRFSCMKTFFSMGKMETRLCSAHYCMRVSRKATRIWVNIFILLLILFNSREERVWGHTNERWTKSSGNCAPSNVLWVLFRRETASLSIKLLRYNNTIFFVKIQWTC